jgi:hypothetical protein
LLQEVFEGAQFVARHFESGAGGQLHVGDEEALLARREEGDGQETH